MLISPLVGHYIALFTVSGAVVLTTSDPDGRAWEERKWTLLSAPVFGLVIGLVVRSFDLEGRSAATPT